MTTPAAAIEPVLVDVDTTGKRPRRPIRDRFMSFVRPNDNGCWEWIGAVGPNGYGQFYPTRDTKRSAHRVAYQLLVGPIPEGLSIDHLCRNKRCVNPAHLEAVTHAENCRRGVSPVAQNARKTHCKNGHELVGDNLYVAPKGSRNCRTCARASEASRPPRTHTRIKPLDPTSELGQRVATGLADVLDDVAERQAREAAAAAITQQHAHAP